MKKVFRIIFIIFCIAGISISSYCLADSIKQVVADIASFRVYVNNIYRNMDDTDILVVDGVSYLPVRYFAESMNGTVKWKEDIQKIDILTEFPIINHLEKFQDEQTKKYGYKDEEGNIVIDAQYDDASNFVTGTSDLFCGAAIVSRDNEIFFINKSGKELLSYDKDYYDISIQDGFSEGACVLKTYPMSVQEMQGTSGGEEPKYTYIDYLGNQVIEKEFEYARNFSEGYAVVRRRGGMLSSLQTTYSYIDKSGEFASDNEYAEAGDFSGGYAKVVKPNGEKGKIDKNFKFYPEEE